MNAFKVDINHSLKTHLLWGALTLPPLHSIKKATETLLPDPKYGQNWRFEQFQPVD